MKKDRNIRSRITRRTSRERVSRKSRRPRVSRRTSKRRRTRRTRRKGGGGKKGSRKSFCDVKLTMMVFLTIFWSLIYLSGMFDYGKEIEDYIPIDKNGAELAESLGVGLIKYDPRIHRIMDDMLESIDHNSLGAFSAAPPISFHLKLDDKLQIDGIKPHLSDVQASMDIHERSRRLGTAADRDFYSRDIRGIYDTRKMAKLEDWRPLQSPQRSFKEENVINTMLQTFMPKILSMSKSGIPDNIQFSGFSQLVSRSPLGSNFHQDVDQLALISSSAADHEYRIMVFDRDETYDPRWTQIATEIDGRKANKFIKTSFGKYDHAKLINFDVDESDYIALIFDNNKVFHRTPKTPFWDWFTNNIPEKRRITQFRISWDDYDQVSQDSDKDTGPRIEEIEGGGWRYKIV